MPLPQKKLIPGILLMLVIAALAAPPLWWSTGNPPVIDPGAVENNHGPANIGQAKHMAKSALDALRTIIPAVADQIEADLTGGANPIVDFTIPNPKTPEWIEKQKAPLLIGQLKAIADPFYSRLHAAAPTWLEAERTQNGTNHTNSIYPWTIETTDDANKAIANIGQLKAVFSFRFGDLGSDGDSDNDGLPDSWELANGLDPTLRDSDQNGVTDDLEDTDGDGFVSVEEWIGETDPNVFDNRYGSESLSLIVGGSIYQKGEADARFADPLRLSAVDPVTGHPVSRVGIEFKVVLGDRKLSASRLQEGDQSMIRIFTDSKGCALVYLTAGINPNAVYKVVASIIGHPSSEVRFYGQVGSDLLGSWKFEGTDLVVEDSGPWKLNGTMANSSGRSHWSLTTSTYDPSAFRSGILDFGDGTGSDVEISEVSEILGFKSHDSVAYAFWFNNGSMVGGISGDFHPVISLPSENPERGFWIGFDQIGRITVRAKSNGEIVNWRSGEKWGGDSWHHAVICFDRSTMQLIAYVDNRVEYLGVTSEGAETTASAYSQAVDLTVTAWQTLVDATLGNPLRIGSTGYTGKIDSLVIIGKIPDEEERFELAGLDEDLFHLPENVLAQLIEKFSYGPVSANVDGVHSPLMATIKAIGEADSDFDGISNLQEYLVGTDYLDFYNGKEPIIEVVSGGGQSGTRGSILDEPALILISDGAGKPLAHAPLYVVPSTPAGWSSDVGGQEANLSTAPGLTRSNFQGIVRLRIQP